MIDQAELAGLITRLMDRIDQLDIDCKIEDVVLVAEIVTDDDSVVFLQTNQLKRHRLRGLLMEADAMVCGGQFEIG